MIGGILLEERKRAPDGKPRPKRWHEWVEAAKLRMIGTPRQHASAVIGVSPTTMQQWEESVYWWREAILEAERQWLKHMDESVRVGLQEAISKTVTRMKGGKMSSTDLSFLKWYTERRWPNQFAPPATRKELEDSEREQYLVGAIPAGLLRKARGNGKAREEEEEESEEGPEPDAPADEPEREELSEEERAALLAKPRWELAVEEELSEPERADAPGGEDGGEGGRVPGSRRPPLPPEGPTEPKFSSGEAGTE